MLKKIKLSCLLLLQSAAFFSILFLHCGQRDNMKSDKNDYSLLRKKMVEDQISSRGVKDPNVIQAMLKVPRHLFVPESEQRSAYWDTPLPIGYNQTISQPYIVAFMTEQLKVKPGDRILEIGTGSGYQAAVLAEIADSVFTIEIVSELAEQSKKRLTDLQYDNVFVKYGDGYHGWPEKAPFDRIIITAAPPKIPPLLLEQLKAGGKMILPVGEYVQELVVVNKTESGMDMQNVLPVRFVPMTGEIQE